MSNRLAHAQYPIVLLLNNDVRLEEDCISHLVSISSDPGVLPTGKMFNQKGIRSATGKIALLAGNGSSYQNYDLRSKTDPDTRRLSLQQLVPFPRMTEKPDNGGFDPLTAMHEDIEISRPGSDGSSPTSRAVLRIMMPARP
jgi:hypothetical protein